MRRVLLTTTLGVVLLTGTACGTGTTDSGNPPAAAGPTSAAATPAAAATSAAPSPSADFTADTKKVCAKVKKTIEKDARGFGEELGKMIAYKQADNSGQAAKARDAAKRELRAFAGNVNEQTAAALDPELRAAGKEAADNIRQTAATNTYFNKIDSLKDVEKGLEKLMISWFIPLGSHCA